MQGPALSAWPHLRPRGLFRLVLWPKGWRRGLGNSGCSDGGLLNTGGTTACDLQSIWAAQGLVRDDSMPLAWSFSQEPCKLTERRRNKKQSTCLVRLGAWDALSVMMYVRVPLRQARLPRTSGSLQEHHMLK